MKIKSKIAGALLSAIFLGGGSLAAQSATIWDTGQEVVGGVDQHYTVIGYLANNPTNSNGGYSSPAPAYTPANSPAAYVFSDPVYASGLTFISFAADGGRSLRDLATAPFTTVYQVTFILDAASIISGMWAADNGAVLYNNGSFVTRLETSGNNPPQNYTTPNPFSFSGVAGENTLQFYITDGDLPSAFAFDVQSVVAAAVPGPVVGAGLPGVLMALGGLIVWRRRRVGTA